MADVSITILFAADDQLSIRLETDGGPATADVPLLSGELIADLVLQLRSPRMAGAAARHLSEALGRVLFAGDAGETLRGLLRDDDDLMLFLATDPRLVEWPWELARDPETGSCPAMEAAAFVRESGGPVTVSNAARRAVLIVPGEHASARVGTLQAATRPLGRKLGVDVFALDPVTGPGLRRTLARGALFVHIETRLQGESLVLDDGHVPIRTPRARRGHVAGRPRRPGIDVAAPHPTQSHGHSARTRAVDTARARRRSRAGPRVVSGARRR